jgi:putative phosphoribosyl transferase
MPFRDRRDAGRKLAEHLRPLRSERPVVVGLPGGGVVVAFVVARAHRAPLDVVVVRKLGAPERPELALGALAEDGQCVLNERLVNALSVSRAELRGIIERETDELIRRLRRFRGGRPGVNVAGRTVILVDDGLATGATATVAARLLRRHGAGRVVLAVPVSSPEAAEAIRAEVDEVVCLETLQSLMAIGEWYRDFRQTSDEEVIRLLSQAARLRRVEHRSVEIPAGPVRLTGDLSVPGAPVGVVVFAHGSGSSRGSPRNVAVARHLNESGLGTLLFDLLTEEEAENRRNVFDVPLLAGRLVLATTWVRAEDRGLLPVGYFGASTGAAAALWAAAEPGSSIAAVVSRGGRPDLAGPRLATVTAPTLLIVGGADIHVLELNRLAQRELRCVNKLEIVPGATHLFEEPGALDVVAELATEWFTRSLLAAGREAA